MPTDTDILLQKVSDTLTHGLVPPSPPPTPEEAKAAVGSTDDDEQQQQRRAKEPVVYIAGVPGTAPVIKGTYGMIDDDCDECTG